MSICKLGESFTRAYPVKMGPTLFDAVGKVNALPFLLCGPRQVVMTSCTISTERRGEILALMEFEPLENEAKPGAYVEVDFARRLSLDPRRSWWRTLTTWVKGPISKFGG